MNILDEILARIPISEVTIKTTIDSYAVIERIEYWAKPGRIRRQGKQWFIFDGSYRGNYFKIQGHKTNYDGVDAFPTNTFTGIPIETSPAFYGRVFDDGDGSIIRGHFGLPFPGLIALGILLLLFVGRIYPNWWNTSLGVSLLLMVWIVFSLVELIVERRGVLDFLKGLFSDVIQTE